MKKFILLVGIILTLVAGYIFFSIDSASYIEPNTILENSNGNDYVELNEILENKEYYVGKEIIITGDIVRAPGFKIYYSLVNEQMVEENIHPYQGLDVNYDGEIEKFVRYDYPREGSDKYTPRPDSSSSLSFRGKLIDWGDITDGARYSFSIIEIIE